MKYSLNGFVYYFDISNQHKKPLLMRSVIFFHLLQLEKCAQDLGSTSKAVGSSMAQLLTCAAQGNEHYTGWCRWMIS